MTPDGRQRPLPAPQWFRICAARLQSAGHLTVANPFRARDAGRACSTHPPMAQRLARVEAVAGRPLTRWRPTAQRAV